MNNGTTHYVGDGCPPDGHRTDPTLADVDAGAVGLSDADLDRIETRLPLTSEPGPVVVAKLVGEARRLRAERDRLSAAVHTVLGIHRPADVDDRLCAEGCGGGWPCVTNAEVVAAIEDTEEDDRE